MEQDERTKKLLAGKEKLAAFQRKRAKRKKKKADTDDGASDYTWSESSSVADLSDVASTGDFSDTGSMLDENERTMLAADTSDEDGNISRRRGVSSQMALVRAENKLVKASDRIMTLEESLQGKEDVITKLLEENDQLRSDLTLKGATETSSDLPSSGGLEDRGSTPDKERDDSLTDDTSYQHKLEEFETALKTRDEVIAQLTENLRATTASRDTLQQEYTAQAAELARQVQTLQLQLQQAGDWLKNRIGEHGISAQALLEAKNELLALQQVNSHKEQEIGAVKTALLERDQALHKVVEQYKTAAEQANLLHNEYTRLQQENQQFTLTNQQLHIEIEELKKHQETIVKQEETRVSAQLNVDMESTVALNEYKDKIQVLQKELSEKDSEMSKLRETVTQKDQSLQQMALALSSMGSNDTSNVGGNSEDSEWTITQLKEEITSLQEKLNHKDNSLQQLTDKFNKTSEQLQELYLEVSNLKEKERDVLVLRNTISEKEEILTVLKETVKIREEKLLVLQQSFAEHEESLNASWITADSEAVQSLQESITKLQEELKQKDKSLHQISESCRTLTEENTRLKEIEQERYELIGKLKQATADLASLTEENKQLKEAENEIASLAQQIPLLSQEMQKLGTENRELKAKESEMVKVVEQMKEREVVIGSLNDENSQLKKLIEESQLKVQENSLLSQQVKELESRLVRTETEKVEIQQSTVQISNENSEARQKEMQHSQEEISKLQRLLEEKEIHLRQLTENVSSLTDQVTSLNQLNESCNEKIKSGNIELEAGMEKLAEARNALQEREATLYENQKMLADLQTQIIELTDENKLLKEKQNEITILQDSISLKEREINNLTAVIETRETQMKELQNSVMEMTNNLSQLSGEINIRNAEIESMKLELEQSNLSIVELNVKLQTVSENQAELEMENRHLRQRASDYEQLKQTAGNVEERDNMIMEIQEKLRSKQIELETLHKQHSELLHTAKNLEESLISLNQEKENLLSDRSDKDRLNEQLKSALQSKELTIDELGKKNKETEGREQELQVKIISLGDELEVLKNEHQQQESVIEDLNNTVKSYSTELTSLKETLQNEMEAKSGLAANIESLTGELQSVRNENEDLLSKVELGIKAQEEVENLQLSLKERDVKLIELTESITTLSQEVTQLNSVNESLSSRENDLTDVQDRVQNQLQMLNDDITALKAENQKLSEKETDLVEKEKEVVTLREYVTSMEAERQTLITKSEELVNVKTELEQVSSKLLSVEGEKKNLEEQVEEMKVLHTELNEAKQLNPVLQEKMAELTHSQTDLMKKLEQMTNNLEEAVAENNTLKQYKIEVVELNERIKSYEEEKGVYDSVAEENKYLKEQLNEALKIREQNQEVVAMEQAEPKSSSDKREVELMQVSPTRDDQGNLKSAPEISKKDEEVLASDQLVSAVDMVEAALQDTEETEKLRNMVAEKDQAIITLHQTVQIQQQSLQEMHQKLTEYSQYVTVISQENQSLKTQGVASQAMETDSPKIEPVSSALVGAQPGSARSSQEGSPAKEVQLEEQKVMLNELTNQLKILADENHSLKLQMSSKTEGESVPPESKPESGETSLESLHAYIHQQNTHMEQMKQKIIEMSHYINQVQEQNTLLREKDASSAQTIQKLSMEQEKATSDRQLMEEQQSQDKEALVKASDSLTSLQEENTNLKKKDKESSEVVQHLMADLEGMKRRKSGSPDSLSDSPPNSGDLMTRSEHDQALDALRSELEEQHGEQIVAMKNQLREQLNYNMEEMLNAITAERDEALAQLDMRNEEPTEDQRALFSHEEMESLHLEIQQLQLKMRNYDSERAEYVAKIQGQHEKHTSEMQTLMQVKVEIESKLVDSVSELDRLKHQVKEYKEKSDVSAASKEMYVSEIQNLNQTVMELMSEKDEALMKITQLEKISEQFASSQKGEEKAEPNDQVDSIAQQQVAEMNRQLEKLARERDEALAHIEKQQEQLKAEKPDQALLHQQVGEALRHEIDALNLQLQEVTSAKDEAVTKIKQLEYQVQGQQAAQISLPETPDKHSASSSRKASPASKKMTAMQQHLLQLQQQMAQDGPVLEERIDEPKESAQLSTSPEITTSKENTQDEEPDALRLAQIQALYDEHCKHQAHQIDQLTAELQRTIREKDDMSSQLDQYQKHYESHLQKMVNQHKKEAEGEIGRANDELKEVKQNRDELQNKIESMQSQYKLQLGEMSEQAKNWQSKYQDLSQHVSGDVSLEAAQLRLENQQLKEALDEVKIKADSAETEKETVKAQLKEMDLILYDMEGKDPNVAGYRARLEDIESTLKVTWIENEQLKTEVATLKSKLSPDALADHLQNGGASSSELADIATLKARLLETESQLEKIQPLVGIEVIVLTRQIEELKQTYSHQLRIHNQELVSVKRELARYQNLDSDSSESTPVHASKSEMRDASVKGDSMDSDSLSIEMGRFQAEHQLEVEGLKRTRGEVTEELNDEKERHRDAMARIEQLLKKMVSMQQKHKEEVERLNKNHEETIQRMNLDMEQMSLIKEQKTSGTVGAGTSALLDSHLERLVSEKQQLLSERDQLLQEKRDWDQERDRLKGRIAQIVGEKDLLAKERDSSRESMEKVRQDQQELDTQMRLLSAEKQQVLFEREQMNNSRENTSGETKGNESFDQLQAECERLRSLEIEIAELRKFEEQVTLLQQERALLVRDHKEEILALSRENNELKLRQDEVETEKENLKEQLGFEISELLLKVEHLEHGGSGDVAMAREIEKIKEEKLEMEKERQAESIARMAEWKLDRAQLENYFKDQVNEAVQKQKDDNREELEALSSSLTEVSDECSSVKTERDRLKREREEVLEALKSQEAELVKLQTACSRLKEERDTLQHDHIKMLETIQSEGSEAVSQLTQQIQELTIARQVMKEEQALALQALQSEFELERSKNQRQAEEREHKDKEDMEESTARLEAELDAYKQKHSEVLDEVHMLRRENYEMRTMVSDQNQINSQVKTVEDHHQGHPVPESVRFQPDSLSPDSCESSQPEREYQQVKENYETRLLQLQTQYDDLQHERDSLSEQYELSQRKMKFDYNFDLQEQAKTLKDENQREMERRMKIADIENERKFVQALQKVRQEIREKYEGQIESLRQQVYGGTPDQHAAEASLQTQTQELAEAHQQINMSHRHQEELEREVRDVSSQNEALSSEVLHLQQHITRLEVEMVERQSDESIMDTHHSSYPTPSTTDSGSEYSELVDRYSKLLNDYHVITKRVSARGGAGGTRSRTKTPSVGESYADSLDEATDGDGKPETLHQELVVVKGENDDLRENMTELMDKYIQVVADNENLRAKQVDYVQQDSLEELDSLAMVGDNAAATSRLQARYDTIAQQNEVLRAQLGSYGLPTESVAEEDETLDLKSRYDLIMKENEILRSKMQAYAHQGSVERDGMWKEKYEAILHDYAILRSQLEELGLPINDSIKKGLEELQVKFDQVVKEKETLQVKLSTVRENAEQDFQELQARHTDLNSMHNTLAADHAELQNILAKDKDKSKREYLKIKSKLAAISKETDTLKSKLTRANGDVESLKKKLEVAEAKAKQDSASTNGQAATSKGKKRKQERGNHSRGRKQRRESEALDDSVEMADANLQEELDALKVQYSSVMKENDSLQSEVGSLKCELGSLKARLVDSLRHRLRGPPIAQSTPYDLGLMNIEEQLNDVDPDHEGTPSGRPNNGAGATAARQVDFGSGSSSSTSDLDLTSQAHVEVLRQRYDQALREVSELRKELDVINSKALDELMGLETPENGSPNQELRNEPKGGLRMKSYKELQELYRKTQKDLDRSKSRSQDAKEENQRLLNMLRENEKEAKDGYTDFKDDLQKMATGTTRTVQSERAIQAEKAPKAQMAVASEGQVHKALTSRTVSLGGIDVDVMVESLPFDVDVERRSSMQKSYSLTSVLPRSILEGGKLEAEWRRMVRMRSRAGSVGEPIYEEGFHPETESKFAGFIPDSEGNNGSQMIWSFNSSKSDQSEWQLMPIEEEFKLQLEAMVANFGEKNVREQLGRDYVELHKRCEAMREENENLQMELLEGREQINKMSKRLMDAETGYRHSSPIHGDELSDIFQPNEQERVVELEQNIKRLRDENQLLLQENVALEAKYGSPKLDSAMGGLAAGSQMKQDMQHLQMDKDNIEAQIAKIIAFYTQVQEEKDRPSEWDDGKERLDQELRVLTNVLDVLKQEQLRVERQIQDRSGIAYPSLVDPEMREAISDGESVISHLQNELKRLGDENQLLLQENALLVAKYESRVAKSALEESIVSAELGDEMQHLKRDKANLEDEVAKIKAMYLEVNSEKQKLCEENEQLYGNKDRLEREMHVLRTLLDTLRSEQKDVESQIQARAERVQQRAAESSEIAQQETSKQRKGKKASRKSPVESVAKEGTQGTGIGKKGTKQASVITPQTSSTCRTTPARDGSTRGTSPMKLGKEPPKKSKKVSQTQLYASGESLVPEEKIGVTQLRQKVKDLTLKNKSLEIDIDKLRKELTAAETDSKEMSKLQMENKALLQELEEMRGSLQSQTKLMDQLQDLRGRIDALSKEKETLKKENQVLSDRINDEVSPPMLEHEDLKVQNEELIKNNRSLMEKLDRDLMQAEHELAEIREKYEIAETQKEEIEDEYKTFRERCEKELYNLQSRYDEVVEERDFLETQLINTKEHAEKDYNQVQAGYEEMRNEYEELQRTTDNEKERLRRDLTELRSKLESTKIDNEELKREVVDARDNVEHEKNNLQQHCAMLQEEKHNLNRELKDYQNRLNAVEKAKDDIDKQKRDIAAQFESMEKYYDETKVTLEEENQVLRKKVGSLQEEYDQLSETIKELKMEKFSLTEELNESRAWCETLEMNLKETESTMSKENYTLKEELRFISEKLETETNVKSSVVSTEEDLRQKLIKTSRELDSLKRDAAAAKEKMVAKLDNLQADHSGVNQELEQLKSQISEKESKKGACEIELTTLQDKYNILLKDYEELDNQKCAIEKEYGHIRSRYGITETQLSEFRRSVLTENVESEKLISKFRVQFEQVTMERNTLQNEKEVLLKQLEEAKAKYIVQREDNKVLRRAMGAEVNLRFQNVSQIESLLGDEGPSLSPISPLSPSPSPSECGSEGSSEESGAASEALISKLHRQNTSLALLIENLAKIKIAKDSQMASVLERCNSLQTTLDDSLAFQQEKSLHEEPDYAELQARAQETETKLQEMVDRCRVLEEELLRLQKEPSEGSGPTKCREKYVVEMDEDVLTVSTVVVAEDQGLTHSPMSSPSIMGAGAGVDPSPTTSATEGDIASAKSKSWQDEYLALQDKYMALLREHEHMWRRVRGQPSPVHDDSELSGELTIEITDSSVIELIAENSRLQSERTRLESELMSQRIDRIEVEAAYTELTWLKEQRQKYEKKLKLQHNMYEQEKQLLEQRLVELRASLEKLLTTKTKTEEETRLLRRKYTELLSHCTEEVKALADGINIEEEREKIVTSVALETHMTELEHQLKSETDEKEILQIQVAHLKKESGLFDRHVQDLEKEIEAQYVHLHAASREHKTVVQLLAETKLELEMNREKHREFAKIGETVERIEAQLSGRSTPQFAMMHSPPITNISSGTTSPSMASEELAPDQQHSDTEQQRIIETSRIVEEMMQLRQEIVNAKSMYTHGNTLLKQAQLRNKMKSEHNAIKEELAVVEEQNQLLKNENEELQKRLSEQEEFVFHVQAQLSAASTDDGKNNLEAVFSQQLELLKSQRDSLQAKLLTLDELQHKHMALLKEKSIMAEKYEQELEIQQQKLHLVEVNELELIRKIAALERHIREQQRLEELIYHKLRLQEDIQRQKETFDLELDDVEKTLQERRNMMKNERVLLLGELKQKHWQKMLRQEEADSLIHATRRDSPKHIAVGFERLSRMKTEVEQRYKEAIGRLRRELHAETEQDSE